MYTNCSERDEEKYYGPFDSAMVLFYFSLLLFRPFVRSTNESTWSWPHRTLSNFWLSLCCYLPWVRWFTACRWWDDWDRGGFGMMWRIEWMTCTKVQRSCLMPGAIYEWCLGQDFQYQLEPNVKSIVSPFFSRYKWRNISLSLWISWREREIRSEHLAHAVNSPQLPALGFCVDEFNKHTNERERKETKRKKKKKQQ